MYKDLDINDIRNGVVYVSAGELREIVGDLSKTTLNFHINTGVVDAYRFRNRTFFLPEEAEKYVKLWMAGVLTRRAPRKRRMK